MVGTFEQRGVLAGPASSSETGNRYPIAVLGKALDLIDTLDTSGPMTLTRLSETTGIHKATALRILANLEDRGYVERETRGRYHLGVRLLQLGARTSAGLDLRTVARPVLEALHREFDETINLAVPVTKSIVYIDILQSSRGLRMAATVGMQDTYHSSSLGKAILAHLPESSVDQLLGPNPLLRKTDRTVPDRTALRAELSLVRRQGFAIDDEENEPGARCIGAPVFDHRGQCIAAISVAGSANRITPELFEPIAARLVAAAAAVSSRMGFSPVHGSNGESNEDMT